MRKFALVGVAVAAVTVFGQLPADAYYGNGAWCAVQSIGPGVTERCYFNDWETCSREVIAGNRGFCIPNPYWSGPYGYAEPARRTNKRKARHR